MKIVRKLLMSLIVLIAAIAFQNAAAKTITVHSTADDGPGSLRQAIVQASNGDRINVAINGTIALTTGELLISKDLTIGITTPSAATLAVAMASSTGPLIPAKRARPLTSRIRF